MIDQTIVVCFFWCTDQFQDCEIQNMCCFSANDLLDEVAPEKQRSGHGQKPPRSVAGSHVSTSPPATQHHRSRSDLTDSILLKNKWIKYEEMKRQERKNRDSTDAPLAVPESSLTLATLNLEDIWTRRGCDQLMKLKTGPVLYVPQVGIA